MDFDGRNGEEDYKVAKQLDQLNGGNLAEQVLKEIGSLTLEQHQIEILSAFYRARREATDRERIPYATLTRILATINYETDLAIGIVQSLDDHLLQLINERDKKELERMRNK